MTVETETPPAPKEPETFSRDYVRELREENKHHRLQANKATIDAQAAIDAATTEAQTKISAAEQRANERVVRAELKTAAMKAGMVDLDFLKLADLSTVELADDGSVTGADEMLIALKAAKPYLFGAPMTSTSQTQAPPPPPGKSDVTDARKMSKEEYSAAKAKAIRGR